MANGMIAQQVNRRTVAAALAAARVEAAEHNAWINAINKAGSTSKQARGPSTVRSCASQVHRAPPSATR